MASDGDQEGRCSPKSMETETFPSSMGGDEGIAADDWYVEIMFGEFGLPEGGYMGLGRRNGLRGLLGSKEGEELVYMTI
jgi:hypothetical protein